MVLFCLFPPTNYDGNSVSTRAPNADLARARTPHWKHTHIPDLLVGVVHEQCSCCLKWERKHSEDVGY